LRGVEELHLADGIKAGAAHAELPVNHRAAIKPVPHIERDRVGIAINILAKRGVRFNCVVITRHARHRVVTEVKFKPACDIEARNVGFLLKPRERFHITKNRAASQEDRHIFRQIGLGHRGVVGALKRHAVRAQRLADRRKPGLQRIQRRSGDRNLATRRAAIGFAKPRRVEVLQQVDRLTRKRSHRLFIDRCQLAEGTADGIGAGEVEVKKMRQRAVAAVLIEQLGIGLLRRVIGVDHRGVACRFDLHQHRVCFINERLAEDRGNAGVDEGTAHPAICG